MNRSIVVIEQPIPNARHRTGKGHEYTPTATLEARHRIRMTWTEQYGFAQESGAVELDVQVFLPRPRQHYGTGRNENRLKPSAPARPTGRGDWDNFGKLASDALLRVAFNDDGQIVDGRVQKWYADFGEPPRWLIRVSSLS